MSEFVAKTVIGGHADDNGQIISVALKLEDGTETALVFPANTAAELIRLLSDLADEAKTRLTNRFPGGKVGLYRKCEAVRVSIDASYTALLVEFDPDKPHRIGVAMDLDATVPFAKRLLENAKHAASRTSRTPQ